MMTNKIPINPLQLVKQVREDYLRYLKTAFPIQNKEIQCDFWKELELPDAIVKGPLLEITPEFVKGKSIHDLVCEKILNNGFVNLCNDFLPLHRPLYYHQQQAIQKIVENNRNLVITTGTGSGKTEAFLIPIINFLLEEKEKGTLSQPGIRALLLYPMNALANDQMKRLREVLKETPEITFGRYIGETEDRYTEAIEKFNIQFPGQKFSENELISRDQMRDNPPHILLTNYAMLEYLLLRPEDNVFFDGKTADHWKFIVLDEAHTYNGALGIEIAMLFRRLKDRIAKSQPGKLQIIATSATIGSGKKDFPKVVEFAEKLFGETFTWDDNNPNKQDIVEAVRLSAEQDEITWKDENPSIYADLDQISIEQDKLEKFLEIIEKRNIVIPDSIKEKAINSIHSEETYGKINQFLFYLLRGNERVVKLRQKLSVGPDLLINLAKDIFPDTENPENLIIHLVNLATRAVPQRGAFPLIPARYHVFAKALEGAFVCLNFEHPKHKNEHLSTVSLKRRKKCEHCGAKMFEISNCRRCGEIYLVGIDRENHLETAETEIEFNNLNKKHYLLHPGIVETDEDEIIVAGEDSSEELVERRLCLYCGSLDIDCDCNDSSKISIFEIKGSTGKLTRCLSCGKQKRGTQEPVSRVLTGQDAPVSVVAIGLYQFQPSANDDSQYLPGEGRKLLVFSDSRQNAAFFAPYLEQTYNQFLRRRMIYHALLSDSELLDELPYLSDMEDLLRQYTRNLNLFSQRMSRNEKKRERIKWIMAELISTDRYNSLEATGLISFDFIFPENWSPPQKLMELLDLDVEEAKSLYRILLNSLRKNSIIKFPEEVDPGDEIFEPTNHVIRIRESESDRKKLIFSWLPKDNFENTRLNIITKVIQQVHPEYTADKVNDLALEILKKIWKEITQKSLWKEHIHTVLDRQLGTTFQIESWCWRLVPTLLTKQKVYQCNKCRQISHDNLKGICPTYHCDGKLELISPDEVEWKTNHYRSMYEDLLPIPLKAEEHTAQWEHKTATQKQQEFIKGECNVLSCSTTFELGVDVGELQTVLLRNMPPTTANYVQRAGRAGRRIESAAIVVTFCQRRSHDLYYFSHPEKIVSGKIVAPYISLENEKIIQRHIHSVAFAEFFRRCKNNYGIDLRSVEDFFVNGKHSEELNQSPFEKFIKYIQTKPEDIKQALMRIVPVNLQISMGIVDWTWVSRLISDNGEDSNDFDNGVLNLAYNNVMSDIVEIEDRQKEVIKSIQKNRSNRSLAFQNTRLTGTLNTLYHRRLLDVLSNHGVLPKYGFPVDVVELKTKHLHYKGANEIELQRDMQIAISEYAPGAQVVAAKQVWTSGGIVKPYGKEWIAYKYRICKTCNQLVHSLGNLPDVCPYCQDTISGVRIKTFIIPEFGFVASRKQPSASKFSRPTRHYSSQVYFSDYRLPKASESLILEYMIFDKLTNENCIIKMRYSKYGWLMLINEGLNNQQYRVCSFCGFAEPVPYDRKKITKEHENPFTGRSCPGNFSTLSLAHRFMTDVIEIGFSGPITHDAIYRSESGLRSLLYALIEGAVRNLGIRRDDLDGTLKRSGSEISLIIYDKVSGGAGHANRIANELESVFSSALDHVSNECCGPETSCSECLRNYYNQRYHEMLRRGEAKYLLEKVLGFDEHNINEI